LLLYDAFASRPFSRPPAAHEHGLVFWITGLSGAGKTSFARSLARVLATRGIEPEMLDGTELRSMISGAADFTADGRHALALQYARLVALHSHAGRTVICATMSLFHDVQAANRVSLSRYVEVWIDAPIEVLIERDPRKLYSRAVKGEITNVAGVDLSYEPPRDPDFVVNNAGSRAELRRAAEYLANRYAPSETPAVNSIA
jgi:adenylylsulfate kinase-like enzyme